MTSGFSCTVIAVIALFFASCGVLRRPVHEVDLLDISPSGENGKATVRAVVVKFIDENNPPGSILDILLVGCGVGDVVKVITVKIPLTWGSGVASKKKAWRDAEVKRADAIVSPPVDQRSAVAAGIWSATNLLRDHEEMEMKLRVISDLREVYRPLKINFERRILPAQQFIEKLRKAGLLANLAGVQVTVCNVHNRTASNAPNWTAENARELDGTWTATLAAMGAPGVRLNLTCPFEDDREVPAEGGR
jgi:hypothetical protein